MSGSVTYPTPDFSVWDTIELIHVVTNLKTPTQWLLNKFFPNEIVYETKKVAIDVDIGKRRLAPFCSPLVEGKLVESRTIQTNEFEPAYIKDTRAPDLMRPVRRAIGEQVGRGSMSPQERMEANLVFEMQDQIEMVDRRLEWMAAQALTTGTITVTGDGYAPTLINFNRSSKLTVSLSGSAQWGQANISPSNYITVWAALLLQIAGAAPDTIVFTNTPWMAFKSDINVLNAVLPPRSGDSRIEYGGVMKKGAVFLGTWGQYELWLYNEWGEDPTSGLESPLIPDGTILLGSAALEGVRAFGCILDPKFNYGPLKYAPKMWTEENPAQRLIQMQSAPLVIPSRVNALMAATVMASGGSIVPLVY